MNRVATVIYLLFRTAVRGLASSATTSSAAVVTIAITLVLVGAFTILVGNMRGMLDRFGGDLRITAYFEEGLDLAEARRIAGSVATVEGVHQVVMVTPDEALARFRETTGAEALLEGLASNPLPASLEIALLPEHRTERGVGRVEQALEGLPGIDGLAKGQEWIDGYARAANLVRFAALGLGAVLAVSALMIVSNTIRLAIYSREDELDILSLVGASRTFLRVPFLLEGTIQGLTGGLLAILVLWLGFVAFTEPIRVGLSFFLGNAAPRFLLCGEAAWLVLGGAILGMMGSAAALSGWRGTTG
ncbi:MAG: ABC transporter permease [Myxococcota bacterium]|nr:ABC transporter permease [Myxococcota bacterium]